MVQVADDTRGGVNLSDRRSSIRCRSQQESVIRFRIINLSRFDSVKLVYGPISLDQPHREPYETTRPQSDNFFWKGNKAGRSSQPKSNHCFNLRFSAVVALARVDLYGFLGLAAEKIDFAFAAFADPLGQLQTLSSDIKLSLHHRAETSMRLLSSSVRPHTRSLFRKFAKAAERSALFPA